MQVRGNSSGESSQVYYLAQRFSRAIADRQKSREAAGCVPAIQRYGADEPPLDCPRGRHKDPGRLITGVGDG
jgi:hypothetical protein